MEPQRHAATRLASKRRLYDTLRILSTVKTKPWEVGIMQLHPVIDWSLVWSNLHDVILQPGQRGTWRFTTLYPRMRSCIKFDWRTRKTVHSAGGRTPYYIYSQNLGWDRRFTNGLAQGYPGYKRWTRDAYPRNGSFVPVSNYNPDKHVRRTFGFWRMWFLYVVNQRRAFSVLD